jgi:molecular chaperone DnaJ
LLQVPPGTQPDTKLMLKGKGAPHVNSTLRGNQIVHLNLTIPKNLTSRQKELIEEFQKEEENKNVSGFESFTQKAQDAWSRLRDFLSTKEEPDNKKKESASS